MTVEREGEGEYEEREEEVPGLFIETPDSITMETSLLARSNLLYSLSWRDLANTSSRKMAALFFLWFPGWPAPPSSLDVLEELLLVEGLEAADDAAESTSIGSSSSSEFKREMAGKSSFVFEDFIRLFFFLGVAASTHTIDTSARELEAEGPLCSPPSFSEALLFLCFVAALFSPVQRHSPSVVEASTRRITSSLDAIVTLQPVLIAA